MKDVQILKDELIGKGILDKEAFNGRKKDILERLKPRNFLTAAQLHDTQEALGNLKLPKPTGWAHALYIHATKEVIDDFSPDRSYCRCCLINLDATLREAGLKNDNVSKKLATAIQAAEKYGVENCHFSGY
jgi:hypothetical protein